jgi:hypothetical protein
VKKILKTMKKSTCSHPSTRTRDKTTVFSSQQASTLAHTSKIVKKSATFLYRTNSYYFPIGKKIGKQLVPIRHHSNEHLI